MAKSRHFGFTLIELMTVVSIISILAAIAVPNFLNAVIRAKTARSVAEQELILWALEMYSIDTDTYPDNREPGVSSAGDLSLLTTPVPYLSVIPEDSFLSEPKENRRSFIQEHRNGNPHYFYINFLQTNGERISLQPYGQRGSANYLIYGLGPTFTNHDPMLPNDFIIYHPSNGTISMGIISTFGP